MVLCSLRFSLDVCLRGKVDVSLSGCSCSEFIGSGVIGGAFCFYLDMSIAFQIWVSVVDGVRRI